MDEDKPKEYNQTSFLSIWNLLGERNWPFHMILLKQRIKLICPLEAEAYNIYQLIMERSCLRTARQQQKDNLEINI